MIIITVKNAPNIQIILFSRYRLDRLPSQYKHDKGQLDMSDATVTWFHDLVERQTISAEQDDLYIWGIFDRNNNHLGMLDLKTLSRDNFQWAEIGYFMHNQYWRKTNSATAS